MCVCTSITGPVGANALVGDREVVLGLDRDRVEAAARHLVEGATQRRPRSVRRSSLAQCPFAEHGRATVPRRGAELVVPGHRRVLVRRAGPEQRWDGHEPFTRGSRPTTSTT